MPAFTKFFLGVSTATALSLTSASAFDFGGAPATDVSNWTTNDTLFSQGTLDGFVLDWENVVTNTAAVNTVDNLFEVSFEAGTNYTIGRIFLYNDSVDLAMIPGGLQQMTWTVDFEATGMANWIPVIAVTDAGTTTFYRSNNTGNSWNGSGELNFVAGGVDNTFWVELNGDPIGGINESRIADLNPNLQAATGLVQFGFIQWGASTGGSITPQLDFSTTIERFDLVFNEIEEVTDPLASSAFGVQYNANEIFDGTSLINDWAEPGAGGTDVEPSLDPTGTFLTLTNLDNNGWIELNNDSSPWETGVSDGSSWTAEVRVRLTNDDGNAFVIWGATGTARSIMQINTNSVTAFTATELDTGDNTDGFHDFRIAYDADIGLYFFWRDGVSLTPNGGIGAQAPTAQSRFILGDCCSSYLMTTVDIEYVRFDTDGAYAPGPSTPLAITDISIDEGTNMVTLTWGSTPGVFYAVDESPDLIDWSIEVDDGSEATGDSTSITFNGPPAGTPQRYYRVRVAD